MARTDDYIVPTPVVPEPCEGVHACDTQTTMCVNTPTGAAVPTEMEIRALDYSAVVTSNEVLAVGVPR